MMNRILNPRQTFTSITGTVKDYWTRFSKVNYQTTLQVQKYFTKMIRSISGGQGIYLDSDGTILSWNSTFQDIKRYSTKEILGQHLRILYLPLQRQEGLAEKLIQTAMEKGSAVHKGKHARKDGTFFQCLLKITGIKNSERKIIGFMANISEIRVRDSK